RAPPCKALLDKRDSIQQQLDTWHQANKGKPADIDGYLNFLRGIGYLVEEPANVAVATSHVDPEIATLAGPQLVVPVTNARYALNAANARWGSLYDALYGTDAISEDGAPRGGQYNPQRGAKVIAFARDFLDQYFTLAGGSHRDSTGYRVGENGLEVDLKNRQTARLVQPPAFKGFQGERASPNVLLLEHHGLHVELHIDRTHYIGRD